MVANVATESPSVAQPFPAVSGGGPFDVIEFMEQRPALVNELLRLHVDDGTEHCRGCSWWQSATPIHPCGIRWYAERAHESLSRR